MNRILTSVLVGALALGTIAAGPGPKKHTAQIPALPCATEADMQSVAPKSGLVTVEFRNESDIPVLVQWIDHAGERVLYARLEPGTSYGQGTFKGHPWVITDDAGACIQTHKPRHYDVIAVVE